MMVSPCHHAPSIHIGGMGADMCQCEQCGHIYPMEEEIDLSKRRPGVFDFSKPRDIFLLAALLFVMLLVGWFWFRVIAVVFFNG